MSQITDALQVPCITIYAGQFCNFGCDMKYIGIITHYKLSQNTHE